MKFQKILSQNFIINNKGIAIPVGDLTLEELNEFIKLWELDIRNKWKRRKK
jgi:hypothetical protein